MTELVQLATHQSVSEPKIVLTGGAPIGPETCFIGEEGCWPRRRERCRSYECQEDY